ncbi:MAG: sugar ABC transporter permease [Clostridia bacterium]|nr:sugar ABC transporter permease [Clostridia bacterium]
MLDAIKPKRSTVWLYLLIPTALFIFSVFIPLLTALYFSFFEWKSGQTIYTAFFNGLTNYKALIADGIFWKSFGNNIYLVVACIIGQIGLAFVLVLFANSKLAVGKAIHRTFGFFPSTISAVCIGLIWSIIFHSKYGLLNWFVVNVLGGVKQTWLGDANNVMLYVSIPLIWQFIGYYMVILFSAIAGIDQQIFESAEIDGANAFQTAIHITLPMIRSTMLVCLTLCIAGNMKAFDSIWTMTAGGPGYSSYVMALYGYTVSFQQSNLGYGSAISVGIFVLSLAVIGISRVLINRATKGLEG